MKPSLLLESFSVLRQEHSIINDLSLRFNAGEIIAIVGANGIGKSTFLHGLSGLLATKGRVVINECDTQMMSMRERAQKISLLMQSSPSHPYCLAYNRIAQGLVAEIGFKLSLTKQAHDLIVHCADKLRITHLLKRSLSKMSGGELRLVNIAKCLVSPRTAVILLDEPSVFLDFVEKENLASQLRERASQGAVILFSSHDQQLIEACASKVLYFARSHAYLIEVKEFFQNNFTKPSLS